VRAYTALGTFFLAAAATISAGLSTAGDDDEWARELEMLRSVPYVAVSEAPVGESGSGVVLFDRERACPGYNLYCTRYTGQAFLLDMEGQPVQEWQFAPPEEGGSFHHVVMLADGDLLAIEEHRRLIRFDWSSRPVWERRLTVHHDVALAPDGTCYAIIRESQIYRKMRVWFDAIAHVTIAGNELYRWSTFDHLAELKKTLDTRSFLDTVLDSAFGGRPDQGVEATRIKKAVAKDRYDFDYFHLNTITVIPPNDLGEQDARFAAGNLLVCFRNVNQIAVLKKDSYRVLWAWGQGQLEWPHHPTLLPDGHILVFDNGVRRQRSRVLELEPATGAILWEYQAPLPEDFYSQARGSAQRLPNGNTLICESDKGQVFEVTPQGEMVWLWLNPATDGGHRRVVYRMLRLPGWTVGPLVGHDWWWLDQ